MGVFVKLWTSFVVFGTPLDKSCNRAILNLQFINKSRPNLVGGTPIHQMEKGISIFFCFFQFRKNKKE